MNSPEFTVRDALRLSIIKRWAIIDMSREQSVAEHSYNVAMISMGICREFKMEDLIDKVLSWALIHDLPEIDMGDVPSSLKAKVSGRLDKIEEDLYPLYTYVKKSHGGGKIYLVVKAADYIDAIQFANKYCIDERKEEIIGEMLCKLNEVISKLQTFPGGTGDMGLTSIERLSEWLDLKIL